MHSSSKIHVGSYQADTAATYYQVRKAVMALQGYLQKKNGAGGLLAEEEVLWLTMSFKKVPNLSRHPKRM